PYVVDGAHLDVDPAIGQGELAYRMLIQVGRDPGAALRPGDPQSPGRRGPPMQCRPPAFQAPAVRAETDDHLVRAFAGTAHHPRTGRRLTQVEPCRRAVEQDVRVRGDTEFLGQRRTRISGHAAQIRA